MKYFILAFLPITLFAQKPLWEEDPHFCYYRTLQIESSVNVSHFLIKELKKHDNKCSPLIDAIEFELMNCKAALHHDE